MDSIWTAPSGDPIEVRTVDSARDLRLFRRFPYRLHRQAAYWVPPLRLLDGWNFDEGKNRYLARNAHRFFLATHRGRVVGRISAQLNDEHQRVYEDGCGFVGFFESVNSQSVANALFNAASDWLRGQGCRSVCGPADFTVNDSAGLLTEGFGSRPAFGMKWTPNYYRSLWMNFGFLEEERHYAWGFYRDIPLHPLVHRIADTVSVTPGLTLRPFRRDDFDEDLRRAYEVYTKAWQKDWANYPPAWEDFYRQARYLRYISHREFVWIALIHDNPVGVGLAIPDINEVLLKGRGRLSPWMLWKLWRYIRHPKSLRIMVLELDVNFFDSGIDALLYRKIHRQALTLGLQHGEVSWIRDSNHRMNKLMEKSGGQRDKIYTMYRMPLQQ